MHGRSKPTFSAGGRPAPLTHATGAVTWIDARHAVVARTTESGGRTVSVVEHGHAATIPFLARVVDEIGDRDRVVILGPDRMRVELEREYVTIYRRPDRILDVEQAPVREARADALVRRLEALTAD